DRRNAVLGRRRNHERGGPAAEGFADGDSKGSFELRDEVRQRVEPLRARVAFGVRATYDLLGNAKRSAHRGIVAMMRAASSAIPAAHGSFDSEPIEMVDDAEQVCLFGKVHRD